MFMRVCVCVCALVTLFCHEHGKYQLMETSGIQYVR
jgi:hypothetical protein